MYKNGKLEGHQVTLLLLFVSSLSYLHRSHDQMSVTDTSIRTDALTVFLPFSFLFCLFSYSMSIFDLFLFLLCPLFPLANHFPIYMLARLPLCSLLSHCQLSNEFLLLFCVYDLYLFLPC